MNREPIPADFVELSRGLENTVVAVESVINGISTSVRDITMISAQVEIETKRLDNALDCLLIKTRGDIQMYRDTLPLLEKNFNDIQLRMDRLMDKTMDLLSEDISETSLKRQEIAMQMIEMTNNSLNNLISKLLPSFI